MIAEHARLQDHTKRMHEDLRDFSFRTKSEIESAICSGQGRGHSDVRDKIETTKELVVNKLKDGVTKEELVARCTSLEIRI